MPDTGKRGRPAEVFSEKGFYLAEFRGRTLAIAVRAADLGATAPLASVLKELEENATRVVLITDDEAGLTSLLETRSVPADAARLEARVWRELTAASRVGVALTDPGSFAPACRELVLRLGVTKLLWIDGEGGLARPDGRRLSFVDLLELRALLETSLADERLGNAGRESHFPCQKIRRFRRRFYLRHSEMVPGSPRSSTQQKAVPGTGPATPGLSLPRTARSW